LEKGRGAGRLRRHPPERFGHAELSRFYFNNVIGNQLETTIALHYLMLDGVLERPRNQKFWLFTVGATSEAIQAALTTPGRLAR